MSEQLLDRSLDPDSPVPLYHQLKQLFIDSITSGALAPGDSLPSEHTLEENLHISRSTIRRAMSELEHEGYIYRQRGRPTLVSARPVYHGTTAIAGFSDDVRSQGCRPWSTVLSVSILCADAPLAERLKIDVGDEVIAAHRLRLVDDLPVCTERPHLPLAKVGLISPRDIEGEKSLYHHLREKLGIRPANVEEIVEVVSADDETADLLQIPADSPVVRLQRTVYDDKGECMEYAISLWRTDRFRYVAWRAGTAHLAVRDAEPAQLDA
jgi:GntR family transcriptional regulator